jgi:hypothetical protein
MELRYHTLKESEEMLRNELALEKGKHNMDIDKFKREELLLSNNNIAISDEIASLK